MPPLDPDAGGAIGRFCRRCEVLIAPQSRRQVAGIVARAMQQDSTVSAERAVAADRATDVLREAYSGSEPFADSQSRDETRRFLQKRLGRFGLLLASIFGTFLVWRLLSVLIGDDSPSQAFLPWQVLSVAAFGSLWLLGRGRLRSQRFLRFAE